MGVPTIRVEITEYEQDGIDYPTLYGKGRHVDDLVYFMLDATFLRHPEQVHLGGILSLTDDEVVGVAPGYFGVDTHA